MSRGSSRERRETAAAEPLLHNTLPPRRLKHKKREFPKLDLSFLIRWGIYAFVALFVLIMLYEIVQALIKKESQTTVLPVLTSQVTKPLANPNKKVEISTSATVYDAKQANNLHHGVNASKAELTAKPEVSKTPVSKETVSKETVSSSQGVAGAGNKPSVTVTEVKKDAPRLKSKRHVVKKGDTLYKLSRRYYQNRHGVMRIAAFNGLSRDSHLVEGTVLYIPLTEK